MSDLNYAKEFDVICNQYRIRMTLIMICDHREISPASYHGQNVSKYSFEAALVSEQLIGLPTESFNHIARLNIRGVSDMTVLSSEECEMDVEKIAKKTFMACYTSYMKYNGHPWKAEFPDGVVLDRWLDAGWKQLIRKSVLYQPQDSPYNGWMRFKTGQHSSIYEKLAEDALCLNRIHPADYTDTIRTVIARTHNADCRGMELLGAHQTRELCLMGYRHDPETYWDILRPGHKKYVVRHALVDVLKYVSQLELSINAIAEIINAMFVAPQCAYRYADGTTMTLHDLRLLPLRNETVNIWSDVNVLAWHEIWAIAVAVYRVGQTQ